MAERIVTTWTGGGPSITPYAEGQTVAQWIDAAEAESTDALLSGPPDPAFPIVTRWKSGGITKEVETAHQAGESTAAWIDRHWARVREKMATNPPDTA